MKLRTLLTGLIAFVILSHAWAGGSEAPKYEVLDPPQATKTGNKIEIVEVFWYGCPHCYSLEPYLEKWQETKPDDVEFRRIPGVLRKNWLPHARAYFTAEILGILDKIHKPLFDAIHSENKNIMDEKELRDFFVKQGIKKDDFNKVYQSEEVSNLSLIHI